MKMKQKKFLLIDNSNTRTKFLLSVDGAVEGTPDVIMTSDVSEKSVFNLLGTREYDGVVVSSVVPETRAVLGRCFDCPMHFINHSSAQKLNFDYPGVETLGADRIANVMGAVSGGDVPAIVIDAGTAVTYDVVLEREGEPVYVGGAISPGLSVFTGYLHTKTALLPRVSCCSGAKAIGKNTVEAIQSGALFGFCGMVQGIIRNISDELGVKPKIVLTGGDSLLLSKELDFECFVEPLLGFKGMADVVKRFF